MKTESRNMFKVLSRRIAIVPKTSFEHTLNLLNFFTPLGGAVYLILLEESYKQNSNYISVTYGDIKKRLDYKLSLNIQKALIVLNKLGLIVIKKKGTTYSYELKIRYWNDVLKTVLTDEIYTYLINNVCVSSSKKRKMEKHRQKFGRYFDVDKKKLKDKYEEDILSKMIQYIRSNGLEDIITRYKDVSWKTKDKERSFYNYGMCTIDALHTIGASNRSTLHTIDASNNPRLHTIDTPNEISQKNSGGRYLPSSKNFSEHDLDVDLVEKNSKSTIDALFCIKGLKDKEAFTTKQTKAVPDKTVVNNRYMLSVTNQPKVINNRYMLSVTNQPKVVNNSYMLSLTNQPKVVNNDCHNINNVYGITFGVMKIKKAIRKWNEHFPIFDKDEETLEEAIRQIKKYKLKKDQIYEYAKYVIYQEYIPMKNKRGNYLCSWFKKPERVERFLQYIAVEKQQEKDEGFERYKRMHKAKLLAKEKMGGRAGHAYEKSEKRLREDYEFEQLSAEEKREVILKQFDVDREGMKFLRRKMIKNYEGVTMAVRFYRRKLDNKIYIQYNGMGLWRKSKLDLLLSKKYKDTDEFEPDLPPNTEI